MIVFKVLGLIALTLWCAVVLFFLYCLSYLVVRACKYAFEFLLLILCGAAMLLVIFGPVILLTHLVAWLFS